MFIKLVSAKNHNAGIPQQNEGFIIFDGKDVCVIDGGAFNDETNFLNILKKFTSKNIVKNWFISHYHDDHIGVIISLLEQEKIRIENLYFSFPNISKAKGIISDYDLNLIKRFEKLVKTSKYIGVTHTPTRGNRIFMNDFFIEVLNDAFFDYDLKYDNFANDSSVIYKLVSEKNRILFLGDISLQSEEFLKDEKFKKDISDCDIIQLAHHGQSGVPLYFYDFCYSMRKAVFNAPDWLYFNFGSNKEHDKGPYLTVETKKYLKNKGDIEFIYDDGSNPSIV